MSAINPAELMRATAVTRIYSRSMQKRETPPLPAPTRYYLLPTRVIFRPPVIPGGTAFYISRFGRCI